MKSALALAFAVLPACGPNVPTTFTTCKLAPNGRYDVRLAFRATARSDAGACSVPGPLDGIRVQVTIANSGYAEVVIGQNQLACTQSANDAEMRTVTCTGTDGGAVPPFDVQIDGPCGDDAVSFGLTAHLAGCKEIYEGVGTYTPER